MSFQVAIPVRLDAFVLNKSVVDTGKSFVAPITSPNFTGLRIDPALIQNDVQEHIDLTTASSSATNTRFCHVDTGKERTGRSGVYLHWSIPRMYRGGSAATESGASRPNLRKTKGFTTDTSQDAATPEFLPIPNRWLVTRRLDPQAVTLRPNSLPPKEAIQEFKSWVVESDKIRTLDEFAKDADLEVECVPFLHGTDTTAASIKQQAQVCLGQTFEAFQWMGDHPTTISTTARAKLSVLTASNPLFADYQPFNSSVFSFIDNFSYIDNKGNVDYFAFAMANYSVIGWHADPSQDPFQAAFSNTNSSVTHGQLLQNSFLKLFGIANSNGVASHWLQTSSPTRSVYHGAMYDVHWQFDMRPFTWPANKFASSFHNSQPLAVGNTAMDALIAYLKSLPKPTELELDLLAIQNLLVKQNDGVDVQAEAADLLYKRNFSTSSGGRLWTPSGQNSAGTYENLIHKAKSSGAKSPFDDLQEINMQQRALNIMRREKELLQWELFAEWWKAVTTQSGTTFDDSVATKIASRLVDLGDDKSTSSQIGKAKADIDNGLNSLGLKVNHATEDPFFGPKDPTILLAGVKSPWPADYTEDLLVRLDSNIATSAPIDASVDPSTLAPSTDSDPTWSALDTYIQTLRRGGNVFPSDLDVIIFQRLLLEFRALRPQLNVNGNPVLLDPQPDGATFPVFHDDGTVENVDGLDRWLNTQPFFPLFLEWEAEYHHVEIDHWDLENVVSSPTQNTLSGTMRLQYAISTDLRNEKRDIRVLSGRALILPQGSLSLKQSVTQIIKQTPPAQLPLTADQIETLTNDIRQLPVLSATLTGFTNHLKTQLAGTHIKPILRLPGQQRVAMEAGVVQNTVFTQDKLILMGSKTGTTPYGTLVTVDPAECPFKPATHGQFKFIKFNLIDKFGQAVCAISPQPRRIDGTTEKNRLYPCLSDNYKPQMLNGSLNTVEPDPPSKNSFVQIPPYLNQDSRINAHIMIENPNPAAPSKWRVAEEWEQQAVGWVILNFPDFGLQFFQPDGTFYREIRKGGPWPLGDSVSQKWLPFGLPDEPTNTALDRLIAQLKDPNYLDQVFTILSTATADLQNTPNEYSGYLQSLIGRPFAIVNMGWSLELATQPLSNQATGTAQQQPPFLTRPSTSTFAPSQTYSFPVKLGDKDRTFDGLACYFNTGSDDSINFGEIIYYKDSTTPTIFPPSSSNPPSFPILSPFYNSASGSDSGPSITDAYNKELQVFGAIIDPFTAIHGYSGILPVKELKFPHWALEKALQSMTYFFQAGPLLVPQDVPPFETGYEVSANSKAGVSQPVNSKVPLPVPAVAVGDWMWLQPYAKRYNALALSKQNDERARFEKAPYTAVEGYLQLRGPLSKEASASPS